MAGLLDIFGTGGTESLGLLGMSAEDIKRARDEAQAQAMFSLAGRLFQGGNTGASIAQGLQMGQQAYKEALQGQMQDKLQAAQLQDMIAKRQEAQAAKAREAAVQNIIGQAYRPAQTTYEQLTPQQMEQAAAGQRAVGQTTTPAQFDLKSAVPLLMSAPEGRKALGDIATAIPQLKKAGLFGEQQQENPFTLFVADPTVPAPLRAMAQQYQRSYASGQLDQETADKRFAELASRVQSAQQFQQTQAGLEAQRAQTNALATGNQAISQNLAGLREAEIAQRVQQREEERQKPVTEAKEAISLINQAEKLLPQATGSLIGTGVDILAGSVGKSTPGAEASAKLKAIQGALVAKMPKMSGPQSDKDVLLYREMAAQVGDSTLPTDTRKAALETLREIQERYAKVPEGSSKPVEPTSPFKFDAAKENRYQQWLKQQGR